MLMCKWLVLSDCATLNPMVKFHTALAHLRCETVNILEYDIVSNMN